MSATVTTEGATSSSATLQRTGAPPARPAANRVPWLDGVRAAAAIFVVLHHMWLSVWPHFPSNVGPWWLGWLLYGHLAVAVFIVVSGFSLALSPLRHGGRLQGGMRRFVQRRAWRILPAYWAALVLSTLVSALLIEPGLGTSTVAKGFVVHGLLVQDLVGSHTPNGAFWSIAIEWQIYFVFPLILLLGRRTSVTTAVVATAIVVVLAHLVAGLGGPLDKIDHVMPQFLALFAVGILAVHLGRGRHAATVRRAAAALGTAAMLCFAALAVAHGSEWVVARYFWIDLLVGLAVGCLLTVMIAGAGTAPRRALGSPAGRRLGLFSYSIYLIHAPILALLLKYAIVPLHLGPLATFGVLLVIGLPVIVTLCYGFHLLFEAPFLRCRDLRSLRALPIARGLARVSGRRAPAGPPAAAPGDVVPVTTASSGR